MIRAGSIMRLNSLVLTLSALFAGCATSKAPVWGGPWWIGNPKTGAIERSQEGLSVSCSDSKFREYYAIHKKRVQALQETMLKGCSKWNPGYEPVSE